MRATRAVFAFSLLCLLLSLVLCSTPKTSSRSSPTDSKASYGNASALLADLLSDYDIRLRPGFGGDALLLTMDIIVASFDSISEVNMEYVLTLHLHQYWKDERLSWAAETGIEEMTLSGEFSHQIWCPDTFLANDKHSYLHDVTEKNKMLRLSRDGRVAYGMRFTTTLACQMNLVNYPLDSQNCTVEIESYGYTTSEVLMKWNQPLAVHGVDEAEVPQFRILGYQTEDSIVSTATGSYQRLSLVFSLQRTLGYFFFQLFLPCILIVMLSWVGFWINHEATSARVALGITTVLTMTTISTGVRQSLPRISYVKSIDIYLVVSFAFVFAALLEYAAVNWTFWGRKSSRLGKRKVNEEGWPVTNGDVACPEDAEGAPDWRVPKTLIEEGGAMSGEAGAASVRAVVKRPSSPLPSLYPSPQEETSLDAPEYPRFAAPQSAGTSTSLRQRPTGRAKRRAAMARAKGAQLQASLHRLGRRAKAAMPSLRVKDVNVIDRYSRVVFPVCFVVFNIFYWGYYTMLK